MRSTPLSTPERSRLMVPMLRKVLPALYAPRAQSCPRPHALLLEQHNPEIRKLARSRAES